MYTDKGTVMYIDHNSESKEMGSISLVRLTILFHLQCFISTNYNHMVSNEFPYFQRLICYNVWFECFV